MGAPGTPRTGDAQPRARGSDRRRSGDGRLDPVRWHRPGRGTLLRLAAVAALLVTAATALWSHPQPCTGVAPPPGGTSVVAGTPLSTGAPPGATRPGDPSAVPAGRVGVPVRLADPAALALVRPGNRVDLLRVDDSPGGVTVATSALVLRVVRADDPATGGLLLALTQPEAERAVTAAAHGFAVLIRPD